MNISTFSALTGLSSHTLRYYEKIGLLSNISRDASGHRRYSSKDVEWVRFINRLKDTGMPLAEIRHYAELREAGDATFDNRCHLLERHRDALKLRLQREQEHLQALDAKIAYYQSHKP
ncbi:MerR family transcriptional regulator [Amphritea atlantica]|uniref:MerR family transcriptional regulator n=1 Tax=Amphritea atlantica TaxID=355243 RepID=UPI000A7DFFBA|nr:MerR family transcriptional regulator [Amphritea atlantica]